MQIIKCETCGGYRIPYYGVHYCKMTPFKDTKDGATNYCVACEMEARYGKGTALHTCGMTNKKCCEKCNQGKWNDEISLCNNPNCKCHQKPQEVAKQDLEKYKQDRMMEEAIASAELAKPSQATFDKYNDKPQDEGFVDNCKIHNQDIRKCEECFESQEVLEKNKCYSENGNGICIGDKLKEVADCKNCEAKENDWEKDLDKEFFNEEDEDSLGIMYPIFQRDLKSFITKTISQEKEKWKKELIEWCKSNRQGVNMQWKNGYNHALEDIVKFIKNLFKS